MISTSRAWNSITQTGSMLVKLYYSFGPVVVEICRSANRFSAAMEGVDKIMLKPFTMFGMQGPSFNPPYGRHLSPPEYEAYLLYIFGYTHSDEVIDAISVQNMFETVRKHQKRFKQEGMIIPSGMLDGEFGEKLREAQSAHPNEIIFSEYIKEPMTMPAKYPFFWISTPKEEIRFDAKQQINTTCSGKGVVC